MSLLALIVPSSPWLALACQALSWLGLALAGLAIESLLGRPLSCLGRLSIFLLQRRAQGKAHEQSPSRRESQSARARLRLSLAPSGGGREASLPRKEHHQLKLVALVTRR